MPNFTTGRITTESGMQPDVCRNNPRTLYLLQLQELSHFESESHDRDTDWTFCQYEGETRKGNSDQSEGVSVYFVSARAD
jgi:hypothetical protein